MELIADILLIAGASAAAFYCVVLSRRLNRFNDLDKGVGGAVAVLSAQVDDMTRMLGQAQGAATGSTATLDELTRRAEEVAGRLELLVASMHDLPSVVPAAEPAQSPKVQTPAPQVPPPEAPVPAAAGEGPAPASEFRSARHAIHEAAA